MNRREFLFASALACAGCQTGNLPVVKGKPKFKLGVAGWTYSPMRKDIEAAYENMAINDIHYLCVKDFMIPFGATDTCVREFTTKLADKGIVPYGVGPHYVKTVDELKAGFELSAKLGVKLYIGIPMRNAADGSETWHLMRSNLPLLEQAARLADEYKIDFAIHNHGLNPDKGGVPGLFPTAESIMKDITNLSPRVGLCLDLAYTYADGFDCAEIIRKYHKRLFDVHLRNPCEVGNGSSCALAYKGRIDMRKVFRALIDVGYDRVCGLEMNCAFDQRREDSPGANPNWIPLSVGYFRGLLDALS